MIRVPLAAVSLANCMADLHPNFTCDYVSEDPANAIARERHRGPMLMLVEAPGGWARLARSVPLLEQYPCADMSCTAADSAYPSLGWQPRAARIGIMRLASAASWLQVTSPLR